VIVDMRMVVCTRCAGRQFVLGLTPRRQTREEMERDLRDTGKIHAICRLCGRVSTLKPPALEVL
jgi:hypothetical protein